MSASKGPGLQVGIDYLPAVSHAPGVGRYVRELVRALVRLEERPELALYEVGRAERVMDGPSLGLTPGDPRVKRCVSQRSRRLLGFAPLARWRCADRALGGVDLFHQVLHDAPPIDTALESFALSELPARGSRTERRLGERLARARAVLVFSSEFAERVRQRFALPASKVEHVHVGCEHWRRDLARIERAVSPARLLVLGATRSERRHTAILAACERLVLDGMQLQLVLAGRKGPAEALFADRLARSPIKERVERHVDPREAALPMLVASCHVLVHLSDDEGTPVTPLEAFAIGLDVVASRLSAFEETLGAEALWVDNDEAVRAPDRLAATLARAIERRQDMNLATKRELLAREYTWERNARETLAIWERLVGKI